MRISDWSSDVCSSDLACGELSADRGRPRARPPAAAPAPLPQQAVRAEHRPRAPAPDPPGAAPGLALREAGDLQAGSGRGRSPVPGRAHPGAEHHAQRSEEQTPELQSTMRIPYAVFCLTKNNPQLRNTYK